MVPLFPYLPISPGVNIFAIGPTNPKISVKYLLNSTSLITNIIIIIYFWRRWNLNRNWWLHFLLVEGGSLISFQTKTNLLCYKCLHLKSFIPIWIDLMPTWLYSHQNKYSLMPQKPIHFCPFWGIIVVFHKGTQKDCKVLLLNCLWAEPSKRNSVGYSWDHNIEAWKR